MTKNRRRFRLQCMVRHCEDFGTPLLMRAAAAIGHWFHSQSEPESETHALAFGEGHASRIAGVTST